jgi:hypothetical protein
MHVQNRLPLRTGKECSGPGHFMGGLQDRLYGIDRPGQTVFRTHNQPAALIRSAQDDQGRRPDSLVPGKIFYRLMDDITVFQAEDENSALLNLFCLHGCAPESVCQIDHE